MLEIRELKVSYGPVQAVRGVSLSARSGEVTCIVGPNGAGKSSTMLAAAGALRATGEVMLNGQPILKLPAHEIARRGLSLVPEGRGVFATLTVRENLGLAIRTGSSRSEIDAVCDRFPLLRERLNMYAGHLSGGEQQQLVIARALLTRPKLLLIDEPSLGLSPQMIELVVESIFQLRRDGVAVLVVEQSGERALSMGDTIYVMRNGLITFQTARADIGSVDDLQSAYFGEALS